MAAFRAGLEALLDEPFEDRLLTVRAFDPQPVGDLLGVLAATAAPQTIEYHSAPPCERAVWQRCRTSLLGVLGRKELVWPAKEWVDQSLLPIGTGVA